MTAFALAPKNPINYRPNTRFAELFRRDERNPILTAAGWPYPVNSVFNLGATLLPDGRTLLLARVEDRTGALAPDGRAQPGRPHKLAH